MPFLRIGFWSDILAAAVAVPETPMDEDNPLATTIGQIRPTWEVTIQEPVPVSELRHQSTNLQFGLGA